MNINKVVTWATKKTADGFEFKVYSFDYEVETIIHKVGIMPTRARAATQAKKWVRYIKQMQKAAA